MGRGVILSTYSLCVGIKKAPNLINGLELHFYNMIILSSGLEYDFTSFLYRPSAVNKYW